MNLNDHETWLADFYQSRNWYQYSPDVRLNFLVEEVGELSRAIRALERGRDHPGESEQTPAELEANLVEEAADVLDQVLIIANKFGITPEQLLAQSEHKLKERYHLS